MSNKSNKLQIRDCTPEDYADVAAVLNAIYPGENITAQDYLNGDKDRKPKYKYRRWVALMDGRIVGTVSYYQTLWFYHPQKFSLSLQVVPDYQGQGIGTALYEQIAAGLEALKPIEFITSAYENHPQSIRFLEKRGFEEFIRDGESKLDVMSFDPTPYAGAEDKVRELGVEIRTVAELENNPERNHKLHALDWELSTDAPAAEELTPRSLDDYVDYAFTGRHALLDGFFVAIHGDEYVGLTQLLNNGDSLYQGLTGVKHDYRRKRIAMALKVRAIAYARKIGKATIKTNNDISNKPMLAINDRLGYARQPDKIFFKKTIDEKQGGDNG